MKNIKLKKICIFLSPHLDDAVFSCGSLIVALKEQGYQPVVITVFTKALKDKNSKFTKLFLKKSGFTNQAVFFNKRKKEDAQVLKKLGCKFYHLDFIDIAWRQNQKTSFKEKVLSSSVGIFLYPKAKDIFSAKIKDNQEFLLKIENKINNIVGKYSEFSLFIPLGIGNHVDHLIVKKIGEKLSKNIIYYEDFPYNFDFVKKKRREVLIKKLVKKNNLFLFFKDGSYQKEKCKTIRLYKSQYYLIFPNGEIPQVSERYYKKMNKEKLSLFSISLSTFSLKQTSQLIVKWAKQKKSRIVLACSMNDLVWIKRSGKVKKSVKSADLVTADGMSLVWAAMLLKKIKIERVYGPDLLLKTCQLSKNKKISHYFYGSTNPVLKKLTVNLKLKFPNLKIAGFYPPPFKKLTSLKRNKILNNVKAKRPNIVWVGLGCPKQNLWAAMASKKLHPCVIVGVGAAFDFIAETKKQAPKWMQKSGLEWLFRLICEPKRLWQRYLLGIPKFIMMVLKERKNEMA